MTRARRTVADFEAVDLGCAEFSSSLCRKLTHATFCQWDIDKSRFQDRKREKPVLSLPMWMQSTYGGSEVTVTPPESQTPTSAAQAKLRHWDPQIPPAWPFEGLHSSLQPTFENFEHSTVKHRNGARGVGAPRKLHNKYDAWELGLFQASTHFVQRHEELVFVVDRLIRIQV